MKNDRLSGTVERAHSILDALAALLFMGGIAYEILIASTAPGGISGAILSTAILCMLATVTLRLAGAIGNRLRLIPYRRPHEQDVATLRRYELRRMQRLEEKTEAAA